MKVLALGDPHGELPKDLDKIVDTNKIELIICTGDIPATPKNPGDPKSWVGFRRRANESFRNIVKKLCLYGLPVIMLKGNTYRSEVGEKIAKSIFDKYDNLIHKLIGKVDINGKVFVLFDVIYEEHSAPRRNSFTEKLIASNKKLEGKLDKLLGDNPGAVLVCHNPPYGYLDELDSPCMPEELKGKHVGSKILLRAIKKHQPKLVLCGHIHEAKGKVKIGKSEVVNLGHRGDYEIFDL
jgi:Icc-related predicted phosphoesterase